MDWVRLYTDVLTHPKWMVLSDKAKATLVQAWMFAGRHETGGYVPQAAVRLIGATARVESELEGVWWHRNGDGWHLHDWEDYQEDAGAMRHRREQARKRQARKRKRDREGAPE